MSGSDGDCWLNAQSETRFNEGVKHRETTDGSALSRFAAVARRSHPTLPHVIDGPCHLLVDRVGMYWDERADPNAYLCARKRSLALAIANHIANEPLAQSTSRITTNFVCLLLFYLYKTHQTT